MKLLQRIKDDRLVARKAKDTTRATLLTTLVGEAETALKGKQAAKFDTLSLVKKFMANCQETLAVRYTPAIQDEIDILKEYIPDQLTKEEIQDILASKFTGETLGKFMGFMNKNYRGKFDGKLASDVYKSTG
jgi:hypothetical protein